MNIDAANLVPQSKDGSRFTPDLRRNGSFMIGNWPHERRISTYEKALAWLMEEFDAGHGAYWRRPNSKGNWGIVRATELVRA